MSSQYYISKRYNFDILTAVLAYGPPIMPLSF